MTPQTIKLHKKSRLLELGYADGTRYQLEAELLRVYSPSAEVRGHGVGQEILQAGQAPCRYHGYRAGRQLRD